VNKLKVKDQKSKWQVKMQKFLNFDLSFWLFTFGF